MPPIQKPHYTAEDGLKVLDYLGLTNLTGQEKTIFRQRFPAFYQEGSQNLISAVWELYAEALPFICGDGDNASFKVSRLRDTDFLKRIQRTDLDEELRNGVPLEEILRKGPHKFVKVGTVQDLLSGNLDPYSATA